MSSTWLWIILFVVLVLVLYFAYRKNFKILKVPSVCLITGAVKTGKSLLAVKLAIKDYRRRHRVWWFKTHVLNKDIEEPLFYTNVFVTFGNYKKFKKKGKHHKLDKNIYLIEASHLMREKRFNYGSVIFVDEASLFSDSQDVYNLERNAELSLFNKLIAHETKGGCIYYDTQSLPDLHYSEKRVLSNFFFIQKSINFFFFRVLYVREMISLEIGQNNFTDDLDKTTRKVLIWRWWYWKYDRYYYSYLTDNLGKECEKIKFYEGELNSFNPVYRKLSLKGVKK